MKRLFVIALCAALALCVTDSSTPPSSVGTEESDEVSGDQIIVVHFHRVQQCTCCINVGKWAEETIRQYFPQEYESRKIVYKDVCVEENPDMAAQYNAYGPSLFINVIKDGKGNITDVREAWTLCQDHDAYVAFFKEVLQDALQSLT